MKFLKLFSKKDKQEEVNDEPLMMSAITYSIDESGEMFIDVTISEFDEENIKHLANLLVTIASPKCHLSTMEMLKNNFDDAEQKEYFDKLVNIVVSQQLLNASQELLSRKESEEPCIKPSEML